MKAIDAERLGRILAKSGREPAGRSLRGLRAAGMNLEGADFSDCDAEDASFKDCRLAGAAFPKVLHGAHFDGCLPEGVRVLSACTVERVNPWFPEDMDFTGCRLAGCDSRCGALSRCIFARCDIEDWLCSTSAIEDCHFIDCRFRRCDFSESSFRRCRFTLCTFEACLAEDAAFEGGAAPSALNMRQCDATGDS